MKHSAQHVFALGLLTIWLAPQALAQDDRVVNGGFDRDLDGWTQGPPCTPEIDGDRSGSNDSGVGEIRNSERRFSRALGQ